MFGFFKRKCDGSTVSAPRMAPVARRFIEVEVEDFTVAFTLIGRVVLTKEFIAHAAYHPGISDRDDGVFIHDMDHCLQMFMERWSRNGFAVFGDSVVSFSDFMRAVVARQKRLVLVRAGEA